MKQTTLYDVLADLEIPKPEKKLKANIDENLEDMARRIYEEFERRLASRWREKELIDLKTDKIPPQAITLFAGIMPAARTGDDFNGIAYEFLVNLIQSSYDSGHNNFTLALPWHNNNRIPGPKGTEGNKIRITITGSVSEFAFYGAENIIVKIAGRAGYNLGSRSQNSEFSVRGSISDHCGYEAYGMKLEVGGNAGYGCISWSNKCTALIRKNAKACGLWAKDANITVLGRDDECGLGAANSILRLNEKHLPRLIKNLIGGGCRIYFTDSEGKEELFAETWKQI
ncbi:MAG: hypothetical protein HY438_00760 [DPANN group archaeon]|nr:hypothetical protein [DPANN group archaeon]